MAISKAKLGRLVRLVQNGHAPVAAAASLGLAAEVLEDENVRPKITTALREAVGFLHSKLLSIALGKESGDAKALAMVIEQRERQANENEIVSVERIVTHLCSSCQKAEIKTIQTLPNNRGEVTNFIVETPIPEHENVEKTEDEYRARKRLSDEAQPEITEHPAPTYHMRNVWRDGQTSPELMPQVQRTRFNQP